MRKLSILFFLSVVVGFIFSHAAYSQKNSSFTGNFKEASFKEFVSSLENATGYRVFYSLNDTDSIIVNLRVVDTAIPYVLDQLFQGTNFYYAIDAQKNIFITRGKYIQDELPDNFFSRETGKETIFKPEEVFEGSRGSLETKLHIVGRITKDVKPGNAQISGIIRDSNSKEPVVGATVFCVDVGTGVITNHLGRYSMSLPKGNHLLKLSAAGMNPGTRKIAVFSDGELDIDMEEAVKVLSEVTVKSERDINVTGIQMGFEKLDIKTMKKFSAVMGEVDILRVVLALPGVQTVGEASTGLNVRGGSASQNLILYNNAVIYNPTHLFGFFTAFNPDEIGSTELLKSGIPAERGGRLSSIIDIKSRSGNMEKFVGTGGIGPLTGKLTLEGPIINDKLSFLIGARSSYSNWLLKRVPDDAISNSLASFSDVNMGITYEPDTKNNLSLSVYWSKDKFKFNDDSLYHYSNQVISINWKHTFSANLNGTFVASGSGYNYSVTSNENPVNAFDLSYHVRQSDLKADFIYTPLDKHTLNFGINATYYDVLPGLMKPEGDSSLVSFDKLQRERAIENAIFIGDNFEFNPKLSLYAGLRYSFYTGFGPRDVYTYQQNLPKNENNIVDTLHVKTGETIAFYHGPEYRASVRYAFNQNFSVKASYNLMRQYVQILSNTTAVSPTDIWKLSDAHIAPQIGSQVSVGVYRNFKSGMYETSLEGYYKRMKNSLDYKDGADLVLNHAIEADVLNASGMAFGGELMIKKSTGKLNGWVSYTYSRSLLRTNSPYAAETVNGGMYYPSNYDKPHAVNLIGNYRVTHRFSISFNSTYSTGRPITLPLAKYTLEEAVRLLYSERNQYRVPDYFRMDISINVEGNHKIKKLAHSSWTFGVYNITGRKNIYSVFFKSEGAIVRGYKLAVFGTPIPSITYNFRF